MEIPRRGHLDQVLIIFGHLKKYHNTDTVFHPSNAVINETKSEKQDWTSSEFGYVDGVKALPVNMSEPIVIGFNIRDKVDSNHAADTVTRRSCTGFLLYIFFFCCIGFQRNRPLLRVAVSVQIL